jgi:hypothetical protein
MHRCPRFQDLTHVLVQYLFVLNFAGHLHGGPVKLSQEIYKLDNNVNGLGDLSSFRLHDSIRWETL